VGGRGIEEEEEEEEEDTRHNVVFHTDAGCCPAS
jgi:hypothetical protein